MLLGLSLTCFLWVRHEQRQYALNRQLIAALVRDDSEQALTLVEVGADPNTRLEPPPFPSLPVIIDQLLHHSSALKDSPTAFMLACGAEWMAEDSNYQSIKFASPLLVQAMIYHHANVHACNSHGWTALHFAVYDRETFNAEAAREKDSTIQQEAIIKLLLNSGADPDSSIGTEDSALVVADRLLRPDLVTLLRKYSKRP